MLKNILNAFALSTTGLFSASVSFAHEGANTSHFVTQPDHTLMIVASIGLIGFVALLWFQKNKKHA